MKCSYVIKTNEKVIKMDIEELRKRIDDIDFRLMVLLSERFGYCEEVANYKKNNDIAISQPEREQKILDEKKNIGKREGLESCFVEKIFKTIFDESKKMQKEIIYGEISGRKGD